MRRVIQALDVLLRDPAQAAIRRTFTLWIKSLLRRKAGSSSIQDIDRINDLLEADTMLAERIETWFEEATRKGMQAGMQAGMQQGETRLLVRQLERRFGPLPSDLAARIAAATETQLDAWGDAVLIAPSLDAIFDDIQH